MSPVAKYLIKGDYLKTPSIIDAFTKIDRRDFVMEEFLDEAYGNYPLPIGQGQTISQPATVAFMLELLKVKVGDKVLDIGSGSGWQTALLAEIVGKKGGVYAIERVGTLCEFGKKNVSKYNFVKSGVVQFFCQDGSKGLLEHAPFDRIIAAASCDEIPKSWLEQLKVGGRLVAPRGDSILAIDKVGEDEFKEKEYYGFRFVPLIVQS